MKLQIRELKPGATPRAQFHGPRDFAPVEKRAVEGKTLRFPRARDRNLNVIDADYAKGHEEGSIAGRSCLPAWAAVASKTRILARPRPMPVDEKTVRHIARLARIALADEQVAPMVRELNNILGWVEQLEEVGLENVPALTSVVAQRLRMRDDVVTEGDQADALMANAPQAEDHFFVVPKVVE
jgi:aspartyl-tRNA(Asn)/glutamyl-tRNA(Gln) amidotransferase subunit C